MKVSIHVLTYNHEKYIAQALDSILMQNVNFDYEIIIGEDCSTDNTRNIVIDYQQKYPDKIRTILHEKNVGSVANDIAVYNACTGEYIAWLEGDDYWTSPDKLQKQVDFLEQHPECTVCFHNVQVIAEDNSRETRNWTPPNQKPFSKLEDILLSDFIASCSTMFRRGLFKQLPDWYQNSILGDWALHILNAEHGDIGYINEVMGVYRYHSGGIYSPFSQLQKLEQNLNFYHLINKNLNYKYDAIIKTGISKYFYEWAWEFQSRGDFKNAKTCFETYLTGKPINKFISVQQFVNLWLKLYVLQPLFHISSFQVKQ